MTVSVGAQALARRSGAATAAASVAVLAGLVLDVLVATGLGAGRESDAFVVAARLPLGVTAVLILLGTQVLVPSLTAWRARSGARRCDGLVTAVLLAALGAGALLAGVLALAAPLLTTALGPGLDEETTALATRLSRVMVWTVPLAAAAEVLRAWLNAAGRVVVPAGMTLVLNGAAALVVVLRPGQVEAVPLAYLVGSALQLAVVAAYAVVRGWRPRRPVVGGPELGDLRRLLALPALGAALNPAARAAETTVASFLAPGSVTLVHLGQRLVSAVGGTVLFRSVLVSVLPPMTRAVVDDRPRDARRIADLGARLLVGLALPLTGLAVVLVRPLTDLVFGHGRFGGADTARLGWVLVVLALTLPLSALQRAWLAPWYARRAPAVPLRNTAAGVTANLLLLPVCVVAWHRAAGGAHPAVGIALAYVAANVVNVVHARRALVRHDLPVPRVGREVLVLATGAALAGVLLASALLAWSPVPGAAGTVLAAAAGSAPALVLLLRQRGRPRDGRTRPARPVDATAGTSR